MTSRPIYGAKVQDLGLNQPLLSILIPTLVSRKEMFNKLVTELNRQVSESEADNLVQVVSLCDDRGMTIGEKRNRLLAMSTGLYTCFIDDDDWISANYIKSILEALESRPDVVGIVGEISMPVPKRGGVLRRRFYHTLKNRNYRRSDRGFERPPNHLNPMRRDVSSYFEFIEANMGEDTDWAMRICREQILKTEVFIPAILYYYDYVPNKEY
jgi:glycosyltransferase involved in cell wall biosynthesis